MLKSKLPKILAIFFGSALILIIGVLVILNATKQNPVEAKFTLFKESGVVMYKDTSNGDYSDLNDDYIELDYGSFVKTTQGTAIVIYEDNSLMSIDEYTEIQISKNNGTTYIKQVIGNTWHRIKQVLSGKGYEVETGNTLATVRGTKFGVYAPQGDYTKLVVVESKVETAQYSFDENSQKMMGNTKLVEMDKMASIDSENFITEAIDNKTKEDPWYIKNTGLDKDFDKGLTKEQIQDYINKNQTSAPSLNISSPEEGYATNSDKVLVSGTTDASNGKIYINDIETKNNNGSFGMEISLNTGSNEIYIKVVNENNVKTVKKVTVTYQPLISPTSGPQASITLKAEKVSNGIKFTWTVSNLDVSKGFKLAKGSSANPSYPANESKLIEPSKREYTWTGTDGKTFHFRICRYNGDGTCGLYSNDVTATFPEAPPAPTQSPVSSISLIAYGSDKVKWTPVGYSSGGYKVVWSKSESPVYPNRPNDRNQYFSDPAARTSNTLDAFDGYGVYYIRVCALGSTCTPYSNQITLTLGTPSPTPIPTETPVPPTTMPI